VNIIGTIDLDLRAGTRGADGRQWRSLDGPPSLAQTMVDAARLAMPVEALEEIIRQDQSERLYQAFVTEAESGEESRLEAADGWMADSR
jgi:hypothetical protein